MFYKKVTIVMMLILAFAGAPIVRAAEIPHLINYQGELTDPNAGPIHDPNLSMTFTFYDAPVDGNTLFSETQNVDVNDGLFGLLIGSASGPNGIPQTVFAGEDVYLGIQVGTDSEMTPRQRVTSVAFAYLAEKANDAELLGGWASSDFAWSIHDHDGRYYTESEIDNLFYTKSVIDSLFYTKSEIDSLFYTKSQIDSMFYTKGELDPKLLTTSQKSELTGGGVTSLHYHPTGQLEAWPTYRIGSTMSGSSETGWERIGQRSFSKVPGSTIFRVELTCGAWPADNVGHIKITTSLGTREHGEGEYEDLFDCSSVGDFSQIEVDLWVASGTIGTDPGTGNPYRGYGTATVYAQQNAP